MRKIKFIFHFTIFGFLGGLEKQINSNPFKRMNIIFQVSFIAKKKQQQQMSIWCQFPNSGQSMSNCHSS
jgi:hypothetical protein